MDSVTHRGRARAAVRDGKFLLRVAPIEQSWHPLHKQILLSVCLPLPNIPGLLFRPSLRGGFLVWMCMIVIVPAGPLVRGNHLGRQRDEELAVFDAL